MGNSNSNQREEEIGKMLEEEVEEFTDIDWSKMVFYKHKISYPINTFNEDFIYMIYKNKYINIINDINNIEYKIDWYRSDLKNCSSLRKIKGKITYVQMWKTKNGTYYTINDRYTDFNILEENMKITIKYNKNT